MNSSAIPGSETLAVLWFLVLIQGVSVSIFFFACKSGLPFE